MRTYPNAAPFVLSADGTAVLCGYETLRHIDFGSGKETAWPLNGDGAWFVGGWMTDSDPVVFKPLTASPPTTDARQWHVPSGNQATIGATAEAIGHGGLWVYDGDVLSTNGAKLWRNGNDITPPEAFSGVVWSGKDFYGYADNGGRFLVRRLSDNVLIDALPLGADQRPYTIQGRAWVSGYYYAQGGVIIASPHEDEKLIPGEFPGPIFELNGSVYVVTGVSGAGGNPRGAIVRPWANFSKDGAGWWLPGMLHQFLQARVRPDGRIVVAGAAFPGSGEMTVAEIDPATQAMVPVPPEHEEPGDTEMTAAECKIMLDAMEDRLNQKLAAQSVQATNNATKLEELARAERPIEGSVPYLGGLKNTRILRNG